MLGGTGCVPTPAGLVHCWGGEGDGVDVVSGNNGIVYDDITFTPGRFGDAFTCNGSGGALKGAQLGVERPSMSATGPWTLDMWIYAEELSGVTIFDRVFDGFSNGSALIQILPAGGGNVVLRFRDDGNTVLVDSNFVLLGLGGYRHLAITRGNGFFKAYLNGDEVVSIADFGGAPLTPDPLKLCAHATDGEGMVGQFDSVRVFDRALSAVEVTQMAAGDGSCAADVAAGEGEGEPQPL